MPKVLIIEDSGTIRTLYKHLFERYLDSEVFEASDGLAGLNLAVTERPELVVLDVHLPYLSGPDVLQAIRSDPDIADTPCIAITSENDREVIEQLVGYGIMDIMLKPVDLERDTARIRKIMARLPQARQSQRFRPGGAGTLLVVDSDATFREFAAQTLSPHFKVETASSGLEGINMLRSHPPAVLMVGERLRHLPERLFMKAARGHGNAVDRTHFVFAADNAEGAKRALHVMGFESSFVKSFVPEQFLREFGRATGTGSQGPAATLMAIRTNLTQGLISAAQQALGVMVNETVQTAESSPAVDPAVLVKMEYRDNGIVLSVCLEMPSEMAHTLGETLLGTDCTPDQVSDMVREIALTISGRVRTLAGEHDVRLESGEVSEGPPPETVLVRQALSTALGTFAVSLALR